jgi:hypothetical protein
VRLLRDRAWSRCGSNGPALRKRWFLNSFWPLFLRVAFAAGSDVSGAKTTAVKKGDK